MYSAFPFGKTFLVVGIEKEHINPVLNVLKELFM